MFCHHNRNLSNSEIRTTKSGFVEMNPTSSFLVLLCFFKGMCMCMKGLWELGLEKAIESSEFNEMLWEIGNVG